MANGGWCRLYAKIKNSQIFKNPDLLQLWIWCLTSANYKERWIKFRVGRSMTEVHLMSGQFIFGRESTALALGQKPSSTWKRLLKLKKLGNVDIESDSQYSIVTVCNWGTYQYDADEKEQRKELPGDRRVTGEGQARDTDKTLKTLLDVKEVQEDLVGSDEPDVCDVKLSPKTLFIELATEWNKGTLVVHLRNLSPTYHSNIPIVKKIATSMKKKGWLEDARDAVKRVAADRCHAFASFSNKPGFKFLFQENGISKIVAGGHDKAWDESGEPSPGSFDAFLAADDAKEKAELDRLSEEDE